MNKLFPLLLIFTFSVLANAQAPANLVKTTPDTTVEVKKDDPPKKTGITIPPEKAAPVTVPKIALAMTIDGKVDEEAWKTAAVFKDFYQTYPGDNTAPS